MYVHLLNSPNNDVGEIKNDRAVMGGALCPPELSRNCRETFKVKFSIDFQINFSIQSCAIKSVQKSLGEI